MTSASSASAMHTAATEAAVTAAETALRSTAGASAVHGAAETAVRSASEAAAMHTAAETGLAAGGSWFATPPWSNPLNAPGVALASMCGAAKPRSARWSNRSCRESHKAATVKPSPEHPESQGHVLRTAVKKGMAPGEKPVVIKNYETIVPVAAPGSPSPRESGMKMPRGKPTPNQITGPTKKLEIARVRHQRRSVHHPRIVVGR